MTWARTAVAAVPQRVWMAVAALVVLASVGVSLVLGAGLSTWRGEVGHSAVGDLPGHPTIVVGPPRSSTIVVPTPRGQAPAPGGGGGSQPAPGATTTTPAQQVVTLPHTAAGPATGQPASKPTTHPVAHPRVTRPTSTRTSSTGPSCTVVLAGPHPRGHAYGLFKKAARALQAQGCGPRTHAAPVRGKAAKSHGHATVVSAPTAHGRQHG